MGKVILNYLRIRFDHIVHDQLFKKGLRGAVRSQVLVLLLLSLLTSFLSLLPFLANFSLLPLVPLNSLEIEILLKMKTLLYPSYRFQ